MWGKVISVVCLLSMPGAEITQAGKTKSIPKCQIVFDKRVDSAEPKDRYQDMDVYVMDQYGGHVRRLTVDHVSHSPAWSLDGNQIAYLRDDQPLVNRESSGWVLELIHQSLRRNQSLFRIDADGRNVRRIASLGPDVRGVLVGSRWQTYRTALFRSQGS